MKIVLPHVMREDLMMAGEALMKRSVDMWTKMNYARDDITCVIVKINQLEK